MSSNKYGYIPKAPTQSWGNNDGVFSVNDVRDLIIDGKWTTFGQLELIQTQTVSGVSVVNFTSIEQAKYNVHLLTVNDYQPATDNAILSYRLYESGTLETASVYQSNWQEYYGTSTFDEYRNTAYSRVRFIENTGNDTSESGNAYHYFYNLGNGYTYSSSSGMTIGINTDGNKIGGFGGGALPQASEVDGIQLGTYDVSSNFDLTASLYGVKEYS